MRAGQPVSVDIDTYPGEEFEGTVESVGAGTGAEFSLLPAQNATGNWVKVVQRIAVRIAITAKSNLPELRAGMSAHVKVDTGHATIFGVVVGALTPGATAHAQPIVAAPTN